MVNAERAKDGKAESEWDELTRGPEVEAAEPVEDAEYYRNHLNEVDKLAARYAETHGGIEAIQHGTWDSNLRMMVNADGLPVVSLDLARYLRNNPSEIDRVYDACEFADLVNEANAEDDEKPEESDEEVSDETKNETVDEVTPPEEEEETEEVEEQEEEAPQEESEQKQGDWSADALIISDFDKMSPAEKIDRIDANLGAIADHHRLSSAWEKLSNALESSNASVKAEVKYRRAADSLERSKKFLKDRQDKLKALSPIWPWQRKKMEEAQVLKEVINSSKHSISYQESQVGLMKEMTVDKLTDDEKSLVDKFRALDKKMARINDEVHIRGDAHDIKMRERWIKDQEKFMSDDIENGGKDEVSYARRRKQIADWKDEISEYRKRIEEYQKAHPDFVLDLKKKNNVVKMPKPAIDTEVKKAA